MLNKFKPGKLLVGIEYLLKYKRQENLVTYFFDYAKLSMNKIK